MPRFYPFVLVLTLCFFAPTTRADDSQPTGTPAAATAQQLISQLDAPDPKVRADATLQLNNLPGEAAEVVDAALKEGTASPEAQIRLQSALKVLRPRARNSRLDQEAHNWEAQLWRAGYHTPGRPPAPCDKAVDDAIDAFITRPTEVRRLTRDPDRDRVVATFKTAIDQGCDDPYVKTLYYIARAGRMPLKEQVEGEHQFMQLMDGPCDPCLKLALFRRYIPLMGTGRFQLLRKFPKLAEAAIGAPNVSETGLYTLLADIDGLFVNAAALKSMEPVIKIYSASRPNRIEPLVLLGFHQYLAAYDARGTGDNITPDARKAFQEGLAAAQATLEKGWKLDPQDGRAPTLMLSVMRDQEPNGGRDAFELWFRRATEADPDSYDAYDRKLEFLQPGNHGSREEMIKFGRECLQTSNWRAGLPFLLVRIHQRIAMWDRSFRTYMRQPEVWKDIQDVYEGCLLNFPNDTVHRNEYLLLAIQAKQYDVAQRQVDILGDKADWWFNRQGSFGDARLLRERKLHPTTRPTNK